MMTELEDALVGLIGIALCIQALVSAVTVIVAPWVFIFWWIGK